jgi:hypothetical protein
MAQTSRQGPPGVGPFPWARPARTTHLRGDPYARDPSGPGREGSLPGLLDPPAGPGPGSETEVDVPSSRPRRFPTGCPPRGPCPRGRECNHEIPRAGDTGRDPGNGPDVEAGSSRGGPVSLGPTGPYDTPKGGPLGPGEKGPCSLCLHAGKVLLCWYNPARPRANCLSAIERPTREFAQ